MIRLLASFFLLFALALPVVAAKRVALVIGNASYKFVPVLSNPINDAALIEFALRGAGFEVIRKDNLDQQGMKLALIEFSRTLKQGAEAGMFYYAGHGIEVDGKNYLVPIDSNMQSKDEADVYNFDVNNFMAMMENSGVPFNIMVLDACRNNPFRGLRATGGGLAPMRAPVGSYVAYATAPGSVAADGDGKNSPFTQALAAAIAVPGLALEEVFKQTRTKVRATTNGAQVPYDSSAIEGNFYFTAPGELSALKAPPELDRNSLAKSAFDAAGDDINMLKTVVSDFADTTWGKLAAGKISSEKERKIAVLKPKEDSRPDTGMDALKAAGENRETLQIVAREYEGTIWGKIALDRIQKLDEKTKEKNNPSKRSGTFNFPHEGLIAKWEIFFKFTTQCERDHFASLTSPSDRRLIVMDRGNKRCSGRRETFTSSNKNEVGVFLGSEAKGNWRFEMLDLDQNKHKGRLDQFWMQLTINNKGKITKHKVSLHGLPKAIPQKQ